MRTTNLFNLIIAILIIFSNQNKSYAQITLEQRVYIHHKAFFLIEISENNFKYELADSTGFSLYNLDYSPFLLNVSPPIPLGQPPNYYLVSYVTSSLFDCDSSNIEYVISRPDYLSNFYIYRTDGTLLFQQDSVTGYYAVAYAGSIYQNPIRATPSGTKLFLSDNKSAGQDSLYIYSLCGELPSSIDENLFNDKIMLVYPNPSNGIISFKIKDELINDGQQLIIYNSLFQKVHTAVIKNGIYNFDTKSNSISNGVYFFNLIKGNTIVQKGKFIVSD